MLNSEKVELMARIRVAEVGKNKAALENKSYFEGKSVNRILKSTLFGLSAYLLIICLAYLLFGRNLIDFTEKTVFSIIITAAAVLVGAIFVFFYVKGVGYVLQRRYRDKRSALVKHDILKKKLVKLKENRP